MTDFKRSTAAQGLEIHSDKRKFSPIKWLKENTCRNTSFMLNSIVYPSHARHVSTWLIVPASYDECTALVKSGNAASKHVWKAVCETYRWWKPGYRDLLSYVTFLLVMW